jgi:transposase
VKVNPLQARHFAKACGTRAKTDTLDAQMLATMGKLLNLSPDMPVDRNQHVLKELQVARTALIKERTRLGNREKTQTLPLVKRQSKARLDQIARQLKYPF